jgi:hypothetical protein
MDQDLRVRISGWRFESARSHETTGCDPGSGWFPTPTSGVRLLRRPASAASSSSGGEIGFIRRTCRVRSPGLPRRSERRLARRRAAARIGTWRADHLGVKAVAQTARAGFDSLARYRLAFAQRHVKCLMRENGGLEFFTEHVRWCAQCDGRTRVCESRGEGSIPSAHPTTGARPRRAHLVPKSSGEDARLSTAIGEFDPRRDRPGEACAKGASCTCNAAAAGSIPVLSTISILPSW